MIYKTDYHIHTTFSDGRSIPKDYIAPALSAGLSELGFSEHLTLFRNPEDWNMNPGNISLYINNIESLKNSVLEIKIKTGLEVDYFKGKENEIGSVLNTLPLDYVIGSVHYLGEKTVDFGPEFYQGKSIDRLFDAYFNTVCAASESGLFDIIGHCDLIRIYGYKPFSNQEHHYRRLAKIMKSNNVDSFSTSSLKKRFLYVLILMLICQIVWGNTLMRHMTC
jgi:histidinol-phosphatase (PHP family)